MNTATTDPLAPAQTSPLALAARALGLLALLTIVTGVAYPLAVTGVAKLAFPEKATGSLIVLDGKIAGSRLIGQPFADPKYFWGRPSATARHPYDASASAGSNLGPTNDALTRNARARIDALRAADPGNTAPVPVDLVTSSGSGLDPHISPAAAYYQIGRVARARGMDEAHLERLVIAHTERRWLGLIGQPRVNVLLLNLALDGKRP